MTYADDRSRRLQMLGWAIHGAGLFSILVVGFAYQWFAADSLSRQQQNQAEAKRLKRMLADKGAIRREHEKLTARHKKLQQRTEKARQQIPGRPLEAEFLEEVTEAAQQEALKILDYQRGAVTESPTHSTVAIRIQAEGDYPSICGFLDQVSRLSRITTVQRLQLNSSLDSTLYPLDITLALYFAGAAEQGEG